MRGEPLEEQCIYIPSNIALPHGANTEVWPTIKITIKCTRKVTLSGEVVRTVGKWKESRRSVKPIIRNLDEC